MAFLAKSSALPSSFCDENQVECKNLVGAAATTYQILWKIVSALAIVPTAQEMLILNFYRVLVRILLSYPAIWILPYCHMPVNILLSDNHS